MFPSENIPSAKCLYKLTQIKYIDHLVALAQIL